MGQPLRLLNPNKAAMARSADTHKRCCCVRPENPDQIPLLCLYGTVCKMLDVIGYISQRLIVPELAPCASDMAKT